MTRNDPPRLTRQGVRNLDPPVRNGKRKAAPVVCFHAWTFRGECRCWIYGDGCICRDTCAKCGEERRR